MWRRFMCDKMLSVLTVDCLQSTVKTVEEEEVAVKVRCQNASAHFGTTPSKSNLAHCTISVLDLGILMDVCALGHDFRFSPLNPLKGDDFSESRFNHPQ